MPRPPEYDRATVVDQAMAVFWVQGYGKTSIGDLVEATGLQPGSLYAAFGNKKGMFLEVIDQYNLAFLGSISRGCLTVNALLEMSQHDADIASRLRSYNQRLKKAFAALISDAQEEGHIGAHRDTDGLAVFLMNNIWGMRVMCKSKPGEIALQGIVDGVMAALRAR
jgi:TetR/AcrR family transcriptional repressor of nem operon